MSVNIREINKPRGPYFQVLENYWDPVEKKPRHRTLLTIGYLYKYFPDHDPDDPQAHAEAEKAARKIVNDKFKEIAAKHANPEKATITVDIGRKNGH